MSRPASEVGSEEVPDPKTTHYRAVVRLAEMGVPSEYGRFPTEVWIDDAGRTRRYSSDPIGSAGTFVWEF